jgi:protein-S-isoprenylcysteine O-methyltransferase Ste14
MPERTPRFLFAHAVTAFLALPTVVAGLVPWLLVRGDRARRPGTALGWVSIVVGVVVLGWCVREFYRAGRGTLAPWRPPIQLVTSGLYRLSRNPMYLGVLAIVLGWALLTGSTSLGWYALILAIGFHLRVLFFEEPTLARSFPSQWAEYSRRVARWLPFRRTSREGP